MTIAYVPNDPGSGIAVRQLAPSPDRAAPLVGFTLTGLPAEQVYPVNVMNFATWTAREAALRAVAAFEACAGPIKAWQGARTTLPLHPDAGTDLNAYYDRNSLSFFENPVSGVTFYSGASQDVVAHETGHAILDALKPDLWDAAMTEIGAFHEGFGDCVAIITALADQQNRIALLKADPKLAGTNPVETLAEALAHAIAVVYSPTHNAATPRHAHNDFIWQLPSTLPADGPGTVLINEVHSLGQIASGTFYRTLTGVFLRTAGDEAGLWQATRVTTWLLINAVLRTPVKPRYFQAIGRSMLALDQAAYKGANAKSIRDAYAHHGIDIGAATMLAPQQPLGPSAPGFAAAGDTPVGSGGGRDLATLMGAPAGSAPSFRRVEFGERAVAIASVDHAVDLSSLDPRLAGAVAVAPQEAFVGDAGGGTAALLGAVDTGPAVAAEVRAFVQMLLARDDIAFDEPPAAKPKRSPRKPKPAAGMVSTPGSKTHAVVPGTAPQLRRIAFSCGCRR